MALVLLGATVYIRMMNVSGCKFQLFSIFAMYLRKNQQAAQRATKLPVSIWYDLIHGIFMLGIKIKPWKFHPLSLPCLPLRQIPGSRFGQDRSTGTLEGDALGHPRWFFLSMLTVFC